MNRIDRRFAELRKAGKRALIPYLTAGFPDPSRTVGLMRALERGGADIIELGVPFSDPVADGPTIQRASAEALKAGATLNGAMGMVQEFRKSSDLPVLLFGAYNPFHRHGLASLAADAGSAGVDGMIIPDLPLEETAEVRPHLDAAGVHLIFLIAPTTTPDRVAAICAEAAGFVYYVSVKGVTGARSSLSADLEGPVRKIRAATALPVVVGFGISTPEHAKTVGGFADGAVVGSALIDLISRNRDAGNLEDMVADFMRNMKVALPVGNLSGEGGR